MKFIAIVAIKSVLRFFALTRYEGQNLREYVGSKNT